MTELTGGPALQRVMLEFADGRRAEYEIDPEKFEVLVQRDIIAKKAEPGDEFKRFESVASGQVSVSGRYLNAVLYTASPEPPHGMIELRGIFAKLQDETQILDVTPYQGAEREAIPGVMGWSVTLQSSGEQSMTPGELLDWLRKHQRVRVLLAPEAKP